MPVTFKPDSGGQETLDGVDRHYYEKQVGPASPFDTTHAFRLAAAVARDTARHNLIKRIREEAAKAHFNQSVGSEVSTVFAGNDPGDVLANRSVDGVQGAPDDAIKL